LEVYAAYHEEYKHAESGDSIDFLAWNVNNLLKDKPPSWFIFIYIIVYE